MNPKLSLCLACLLVFFYRAEAYGDEEYPCGKGQFVEFYATPLGNIGPLKDEYVIWADITFRPGVKELRVVAKISSNKRTGAESQIFRKTNGTRQKYYGEPGGLIGYGWEKFPTVTIIKCEEISDGSTNLAEGDGSESFTQDMRCLAQEIVLARDGKERNRLFGETFPKSLAKLQDKQAGRIQMLLEAGATACGKEEKLAFYRAGYAYCEKSLIYRVLSPFFKDRWEEEQKQDNVVSTKPDKDVAQAPEKKLVSADGRYWVSTADVITDTKTGLEWYVEPERKEELDLQPNEEDRQTEMNWNAAKSWTEYLTVDGGGWRMPTRSELLTLYQKGKGNRNMDPIFKTAGWYVWSGEIDESDKTYVWGVNFFYGRAALAARRPIRRKGMPLDARAFAVRPCKQ